MRRSLALSAVILALGAALGWQDRLHLLTVRQTRETLVEEARRLGISVDTSRPGGAVRVTKRERESNESGARETAATIMAVAQEMEAREGKNEPPDPALQKRIMEAVESMMTLDAAQLKIVIDELRAAPGLKEETRRNLIGFAIMTMANDHPQAALTIFTESSDMFKSGGMGSHVVSTSLSRWALTDPMGALKWTRENTARFPDLITDDSKRGLISGTAVNDPRLAFQLIGELSIKDASSAASSIFSAAKTPGDKALALAALRDYLPGIADEEARKNVAENAITDVAQTLVKDGFDVATKWVETAKLSPEELSNFANGLSQTSDHKDQGKWIEWIGEKLPGEQSNEIAGRIVRNWAEKDFQATGAWLNTTPDGPLRHAAIRSYAETLSPYEPEAAAQWATTLPPGDERKETLREIYQSWPKKDPASKEAAAAFKALHGIE